MMKLWIDALKSCHSDC